MKWKSARWPLFLAFAALILPLSAAEKPKLNAEDAWQALMKGNARYMTGRMTHPRAHREARHSLVRAQHPFAAVLCCSDSRVPPEVIFDQGLGDLFVVRVAGNVADPISMASLEYAVNTLDVPLIVVLGHEHCDAVDAAVKAWMEEYEKTSPHEDSPSFLSENMASLMKLMFPAIEQGHTQGGDLVVNSITTNIRNSVWLLDMKNKLLSARSKAGKLKVRGAIYEMYTGKVRDIDTAPDETRPEKKEEF